MIPDLTEIKKLGLEHRNMKKIIEDGSNIFEDI